jgi:adenylate cyclase
MRIPGLLLAVLTLGPALSPAFAQSALPQAQHDSLWSIWSDTSQVDTARLEALHRIIREGYVYEQPDSALHYARMKYAFAASRGLNKQMASALNDQGLAFMGMGNHSLALDHYKKSLSIRTAIDDKNGISGSLNNIGLIYHELGEYERALHFYHRSMTMFEEIGSQQGMTNSQNNIGLIHHAIGDLPKALSHHGRSLKIAEDIHDLRGVSYALNNIGDVYSAQGKYDEALDHYMRSWVLKQNLLDKAGMAHTAIALGELEYNRKDHRRSLEWCTTGLDLAKQLMAIGLQRDACNCLFNAYKALGRGNKALEYLEKVGELDKQLNKEETAKKLQQMEFQQVMLQDSIVKAEESRLMQEIHQEEVRKTARTRNMFAIGGIFFILLAGGFYSRARYMRRSKAVLQVEKDRSENLLLNILPAEIAEELKQKGRCEARDFDTVSILFTDFKGFTEHSATMSAAALVNEINHCFEAFDGIMAKYGIEKIKTIGDAYMAAGGLPVPSEDSVKNTVLAALEMQRFIRERKAQKDALGEPAFEMRVGIHTGPVVAGIVGVKKFQYDIWGDTVNTASRMESSGVVGQVNISESTYSLLKDDPQFQFTPRGKVEAKGKGELEMFLVQEKETSSVGLEQRPLESAPA